MNPTDYNQFTHTLTTNCEADSRIVGLIALGSMAAQDYAPDQWSDHDFFLITQTGAQQAIKDDLSWLPNHMSVIFSHQEKQHGMRMFFADGHLIELAIFDLRELTEARINRYRVLVDKGGVAIATEKIVEQTNSWVAEQADNLDEAMAHFLSNVWVGYGRYQRGEKLSAHEFVKNHALVNLLKLIQHYVPTANHSLRDNLNPLRRFERLYPPLGQEIHEALSLDTPQTCLRLLQIGERELSPHMPDFPQKTFDTIFKFLNET